MLISINRTRQLELIGTELENNENKEYFLLLRVEPTAREEKGDDTIQKVAVDNHLAVHIPFSEGERLMKEGIKRHH